MHSKIRFGVQFRNFPKELGSSIFERMGEVAVECERLGFDSLWMIDHLEMKPPISYESQPIPECWITLAFLAEKTKSISVGSLVSCVLLRDDKYFARICESIREMSRNRVKIGLGSGWFEQEFKAYGIYFPGVRERTTQLESTVTFLRDFLDNGNNSPEIWVGGSGESLTLKTVAKHADACSLFGDPSTIKRKLKILQSHCEGYGRDPSSIIRSKHSNVVVGKDEQEARKKLRRLIPNEANWQRFIDNNVVGTPEECIRQIVKYVEAGVTYFTLSFPDLFDVEPLRTFDELIVRTVQREMFA